MGTRVVIRNVPISFPEVFEAKTYKESTAYSCKFLLDKSSENYKNVAEAIKKEAVARWADKAAKKVEAMKSNPIQTCIIDGDSKEYNGYADRWVLTAKRKERDGAPAVVDRSKQPLAPNSGKIYSGAICNGVVDIYCQAGDNPGIRCALISLQFVKDGENFSGSSCVTVDDLDDLGFEEDTDENFDDFEV
jgi:hypothetical protein